VSYVPSRWLQVYMSHGFAHVDYANRKGTVIEPAGDVLSRRFDIHGLSTDQTAQFRDHLFEDLLVKRELSPPATNAIAEEHRDFAESIRRGRQPRVTGKAGREALEVAERVLEAIAQHQWDGSAAGRVGPQAEPRPHGVAAPWVAPHRKAG
jgi:predicted dehydrogenase